MLLFWQRGCAVASDGGRDRDEDGVTFSVEGDNSIIFESGAFFKDNKCDVSLWKGEVGFELTSRASPMMSSPDGFY